MSSVIEFIRRGESGRAAPDHGYLSSASDLRNSRLYAAVFIRCLNGKKLVIADGDRFTVFAVDAGFFTKRRADTAGEFREIVCFGESGESMLQIVIINLIVPLRDQVVQRASRHHAV